MDPEAELRRGMPGRVDDLAIAADDQWHTLLTPIRRTAVELALEGRLVIYRKGKPVDPSDFRGVYRLGLPRQD